MISRKVACSFFVLLASAAALATSTFAWFASNKSASVSGATFAVATTDSNELVGLNVYKFVYPTITIRDESYIDYLSPQNGAVNKYTYNSEQSKFGVFEDGVFSERDANMNIYDPVDYLINHSTLLSMNTNIIYECRIKFSGGDPRLKVDTMIRDVTLKAKEIKASACLDFNIFFESDLESPLLEENGIKNYYPSYMDQSYEMEEDEEIYHKLSYLSSLDSTVHKNFFSDDSVNEFNLYNDLVNVDDDMTTTVYINVNYNMEELSSFVNAVRLENLKVIDDYIFRFGYGV